MKKDTARKRGEAVAMNAMNAMSGFLKWSEGLEGDACEAFLEAGIDDLEGLLEGHREEQEDDEVD